MSDYGLIYDPVRGGVRDDQVRRASDGAVITRDPASPDWSAYQVWRDGGGVPDPASVPTASQPTVTGNQWAFALGDLGLAAAWRAATAKSKDKDQIRIGLIARDTPLVAGDPLLIRVAANAGTDASGAALIDVRAVFDKAQTEAT